MCLFVQFKLLFGKKKKAEKIIVTMTLRTMLESFFLRINIETFIVTKQQKQQQ